MQKFLNSEHEKAYNLMLEKDYIAPVEGLDVVLTIDETIQFIAERALDRMYHKYNAKGASIIVMDPRTGEIIKDNVGEILQGLFQ